MSPSHYLMESYLPRHELPERAQAVARVRRAARAVSAQGTPVRYLRSIFIPDEEVCFLLFEAESVEVVSAVTDRAGVDVDRVALTDGRER